MLPYKIGLHQVGLDFAITSTPRTRHFVQAYFETGAGHKGNDIHQLAALTQNIKVAGIPFLLVADFHRTPKELQNMGLLGWTNPSIAASGVTPTCRSGRLLDYIVATNSLLRFLAMREEASW